jgi:hypothetical protein
MATSCRPRMTWRFTSSHALVALPEPCVWAHTLVGVELVLQGGDLSCKVETCRARRRLVVRGGDLSCEAETCRRGRDLSCEAETCRRGNHSAKDRLSCQ